MQTVNFFERKKKGRLSLAGRETLNFYLFISPWILGFALFTLFPLVCSVYFSLFDFIKLDLAMGNPFRFVLFDNFVSIITNNPDFGISILNTFFYSFVRVFLGAAVSFVFAVLLNRKIFGKKILRTLIYIPAILPIVGSAIVWQGLFDERFSFFNYLLGCVGMGPVDWLGNNAMWSVILMSVWCGIGPTMIIILAALQTVPQELIEAADIDGAGSFTKYIRIVLPMISSTFLYVLVTGFIGTLQAYAEFDLVTGGGPGIKTLTMSMLVIRSLDNVSMGYACAMAWVVGIIVMIFTLIFFKLSKGKVFYGAGD